MTNTTDTLDAASRIENALDKAHAICGVLCTDMCQEKAIAGTVWAVQGLIEEARAAFIEDRGLIDKTPPPQPPAGRFDSEKAAENLREIIRSSRKPATPHPDAPLEDLLDWCHGTATTLEVDPDVPTSIRHVVGGLNYMLGRARATLGRGED